MADVVVSRHGIDAARRGHPWIYGSHVISGPHDRAPTIVRISDEERRPWGYGIYDPSSPIAVRVWSVTASEPLDARLFRSRLEDAIDIRKRLFADGKTTAYRLVNGEGDRMPGFVIDRYADTAVLRVDGPAARAAMPRLLRDIEEPLRDLGISALLDRESKRGEAPVITPIFGTVEKSVVVREHDVPFKVDLLHGQKTGAFLDQRENRRRIGALVRRRREASPEGASPRVLNLFSYTGGFSLFAALNGAIVTSVDVAAAAHATAQESFRLAGLDPKGHSFVTADCFQFLERASSEGRTWDIVISDPPSFAPNEKSKSKAILAYRALHKACCKVLAGSGTFVAASCSSHIGAEDFMTTLDDISLGRADLRLLELHGSPPDHPSLPSFFEGRYLKLAVLE